jgi:hypothetical protein
MNTGSMSAHSRQPADGTGSELTADEIRVAAAVHHELGPEYGDAILASFLEKVDRDIAARVEERLDRARHSDLDHVGREQSKLDRRRGMFKGIAIGLALCGVPLLWFWDLGGSSSSPSQKMIGVLVMIAWLTAIIVCSALSLAPQRLRRGGVSGR